MPKDQKAAYAKQGFTTDPSHLSVGGTRYILRAHPAHAYIRLHFLHTLSARVKGTHTETQ